MALDQGAVQGGDPTSARIATWSRPAASSRALERTPEPTMTSWCCLEGNGTEAIRGPGLDGTLAALALVATADHVLAQLALAPIGAQQEEDHDDHEDGGAHHHQGDRGHGVGALELEDLEFVEDED